MAPAISTHSRTAGLGWRRMEPSSKFLAVNRWSLIGLPWFTALALISLFLSRAGIGVGALWIAAAVAVVSCAAGSVALHTNRQLRLTPHPRGSWWMRWGLIGHGGALAACALALSIGPHSWETVTLLATGILYSTLLTAYLPFLPHGFLLTVVSLVVTAGATAALLSLGTAGYVLTYGVLFSGAVFFTMWVSRTMIETERSRRLESQLSAAEERLRLSQDLHDTMGQHLAALTIKTQLAQALAARDDPRVHQELAQLYQLTQKAASDMRHVVNTYRTPDLGAELTSAQTVLTAAGAEVTVQGSSEDIPPGLRDTAAWFLREAATNVLRHSQATRVSIALGPTGVTVSNNQPQSSSQPGTGLEGLRRRAAAHGGYLVVEQTSKTFTVSLKVDA